jgi:LPS export ABC transporter protein LptC
MIKHSLRTRYMLWMVLGFLALLISTCWESSGETNSAVVEEELTEESAVKPPQLNMKQVHLEEFQGEEKTIDLWGTEAHMFQEEERVEVEDVRILVHMQKDGSARQVEILGNKGTYDLGASVAVIQGDVQIHAMDGESMKTDMIRYDRKNDLIEGPGPVYMEGPEGWTQGIGFQMDTKSNTVILLDRVRTLIRPSAVERAKELIPQ